MKATPGQKADFRANLNAARAKVGKSALPVTRVCPTCQGVGRIPEGAVPAAPATNRPR